jgi:ribosomal protein L20
MKLKDDKAGIDQRRKVLKFYTGRYSHTSTLVRKVAEEAKVSRMTVYRDIKVVTSSTE